MEKPGILLFTIIFYFGLIIMMWPVDSTKKYSEPKPTPKPPLNPADEEMTIKTEHSEESENKDKPDNIEDDENDEEEEEDIDEGEEEDEILIPPPKKPSKKQRGIIYDGDIGDYNNLGQKDRGESIKKRFKKYIS